MNTFLKLKNNIWYIYKNKIPFQNMSLARITERINEENEKKGKIDGRRFNSRSQKKMLWQMKDLKRSQKKAKYTTSRCGYSKDELEEYRIINEKIREEGEIKLAIKVILNEIIDRVDTYKDDSLNDD